VKLSIQVVDKDAFRDVDGPSVLELSIKSSLLSDKHLPALLPLNKLRSLNIALNRKVTDVDRLLDTLPSLQTLDASGDGIVSLGRSVSSTLKVDYACFQTLSSYQSLMSSRPRSSSFLKASREHKINSWS